MANGTRCLVWSLGLVWLTSATALADWPQFRGPAADGIPTARQLPTTWNMESHIAWKVALPGVAWSQPIVWGDRFYVTTAVTENQPKPAPGQGGRGGPGGGRGRPGRDGGPAAPGGPTAPAGEAGAEGAPAADGSGSPAGTAADEPRRPEREPAAGGADRPSGRRGGPGAGPAGRRGQAAPDQVYRWLVQCRDLKTGELIWEQLAHEGRPTIPTHRTNTYASETPLTDGQRLYVYFGMTGLYCFDLEGKLLWSKDLGSYPMAMGWGTGSSPALDSERLFIQCDNDESSFLVALDKRTGDEVWRVPRDEKSNWGTPYLWHNRVRTELVAAGGGKMRAYEPATGKLLWELGEVKGRSSATPVGTEDLLFVGVGGGMAGPGPLIAIKAGATGDITLAEGATSSEHVAWSLPRSGPPMSSPLVYQGCLYVLDQRGGIVGCYDAATGAQHYRQRIEGAKGFTASPWAYDGKVFCLDEEGNTFVLAAGPELNLLGTNKLDDMFWSSVAVAGDRLLLRGLENLYCIAP